MALGTHSSCVTKAEVHPLEPDSRSRVLIAMGRQAVDMTALIGAISARLRTLHADVLNGEIPKKMAELARQLDRSPEAQCYASR
jgi:hypothetical protein